MDNSTVIIITRFMLLSNQTRQCIALLFLLNPDNFYFDIINNMITSPLIPLLGPMGYGRFLLPDSAVRPHEDVQVHWDARPLHRVRHQNVPWKVSGKRQDSTLLSQQCVQITYTFLFIS